MTPEQKSKALEGLAPYPEHFTEAQIALCDHYLARLWRDRVLDEMSWDLVLVYVDQRTAYWDASKAALNKRAGRSKHFLTGPEQKRAHLSGKVLEILRELIATPATKARAEQPQQTSFMELLDPRVTQSAAKPAGAVVKFQRK